MNNIMSQLKKPLLCISSVYVREDGFKDYRFSAYLAANELGFDVKRNPEDIGSTQESFEYALKNEYPVFILIVGRTESEMVRKECNIALNYCLPLLIFLKEDDDGSISKDTTKFVSNLSKISYDRVCTKFSNAEELYNQVKSRLTSFLNSKNSSYPLLNSDVGGAYEYCTELIENAKKRIMIYQKTSSLILGPRKGIDYEYRFYKQIFSWLESKQPDMEFIHVFSKKDTLEALKQNNGEYDIANAQTQFLTLYNKLKKDRLFSIRVNPIVNDISYVIADANMVLVFPIESLRYSITLPFYLMKNSEILKIKSALSRSGRFLDLNKATNLYNNLRI